MMSLLSELRGEGIGAFWLLGFFVGSLRLSRVFLS
jgi:hypothetical protein